MLRREIIDVYNYNYIKNSNYEDFVFFEGLENLKLAKNRPVILYTCHYSRFVLPLICLAKFHRILGCIINDSSGVPYVERKFRSYKLGLMEKHMNGNFFYTNKSMHGIFKYLRNNGMLVYLIDMQASKDSKSSIKVNFMNREMLIYTSILRLVSNSGAKLIPYVTMESKGRMYPLKCRILKEVEIFDSDSNNQKMEKLLKPLRIIESNKMQWWLNT